tara:strand:+ start:4393 stop:4638 length:246 start_codon:yes stop_codon:yes gene_type:complete
VTIIITTDKENIMKTIVKYATCTACGEEYNVKRLHLGYSTCLACGGQAANRLIHRRTRENLREMAPNSFTGSVDDLFDKRD